MTSHKITVSMTNHINTYDVNLETYDIYVHKTQKAIVISLHSSTYSPRPKPTRSIDHGLPITKSLPGKPQQTKKVHPNQTGESMLKQQALR